jgi:hypothetical protein
LTIESVASGPVDDNDDENKDDDDDNDDDADDRAACDECVATARARATRVRCSSKHAHISAHARSRNRSISAKNGSGANCTPSTLNPATVAPVSAGMCAISAAITASSMASNVRRLAAVDGSM